MLYQLIAFSLAVVGLAAQLPGLSLGPGLGYNPIDESTKLPAIHYTFKDGNKWTFDLKKTTFDMPDQAFAMNAPSAAKVESNYIFSNFSDYVHQKHSWHSFSIGIPGIFSFSMGKQSQKVQKMLMKGGHTLYLAVRDMHLYDVGVNLDRAAATAQMVNMALGLPTNRNTAAAKDEYNRFIRSFGTHFVHQAGFGGSVNYYTLVENSLYNKYSSSWVAKQVSASITYDDITVGFSHATNTSKIKIDHEFKQKTKTTIEWVGGDPNKDYSNVQDWYKDILKEPALMYPKVLPISDLIPSSPQKTLLSQAITDYLNTKP